MDARHCLCLRDIPVFSRVEKDIFRPVCHAAGKRHFKRGEVLFHQGDSADTIYLWPPSPEKLATASAARPALRKPRFSSQ